jgi:phage baseplate assembly protein W
MPNILSRFNKQVIGSDVSIYDYVPKIVASGDFKRVRDIDVIITSWNNILVTQRRTYLFDPNYGSDLYKILFDPVDDTTVERIKTEVVTRIRNYDNRASIENIEVFLNSNGKGYTVNVYVQYEGESKVLTVKFDDTTVTKQQGSGQ